MPLETGNTLNDLNQAWPAQTDGLSAQDDHTRLIKSILKTTFGDNPNPQEFTGNFTFGSVTVNTAINVGGSASIGSFLSVGGFILNNPQVLFCGGQLSGVDGSVLGNAVGINDSVRTGPGTYEVRPGETGWNFADLIFFDNVNYTAAGLGKAVMTTATVNDPAEWVKIVCVPLADPLNALDPVLLGFGILDMGRTL